MKAIEIRGFWGLMLFIGIALLISTLLVTVPATVTWVTWNAIVGDLFRGPMIHFWQAVLLTGILAIVFKLVFQPQIEFQFKKANSPEELDQLRKQIEREKE